MPKSVRRMRPSGSSSTLPGLMSRCTIRARWAAVSASAMAMPICIVRPTGRRPVCVEALAQRLAGHQLHHHGLDVAVVHGVEHRHDRWVREAGHGDRFAPEALDQLRVGRQRRLEQLHGDLAVEHGVGGDPHLGHAADREAPAEAVAPGQGAHVGRRRRRRRHAGLTHREGRLLGRGGAVAAGAASRRSRSGRRHRGGRRAGARDGDERCSATAFWRRLRRRWRTHHVASTRSAPTVSTTPKPDSVVACTVSSVGGATATSPSGVMIVTVSGKVPLARALHRDALLHRLGVERHQDVVVRETTAWGSRGARAPGSVGRCAGGA